MCCGNSAAYGAFLDDFSPSEHTISLSLIHISTVDAQLYVALDDAAEKERAALTQALHQGRRVSVKMCIRDRRYSGRSSIKCARCWAKKWAKPFRFWTLPGRWGSRRN